MSELNGKSSKEVLILFEANMSSALRSHYHRTNAEAVDEAAMPFDRLLMAEDDGIEGGESGPGDYEMQQRVIGVRAFLRHIKGDGFTLTKILKRLFSAGRAMHDPFFSSLTMTEAAMMFSETRAAHSWRCKVLSGEIKLAGMRGVRLPGQKTPDASDVYRQIAKGNKNRAKGQKKRRQNSFLKRLHVPKGKSAKPGGRPKQGSFMRKLSNGGTAAGISANAQRSTVNFQHSISAGSPAAHGGRTGGIKHVA